MGYAAYRVAFNGLSPFNSPETIATARHAMTLYSIQLGLNMMWQPLFFVAKRPVEATVDILALGAANVYLTYLYSSVDTVAAWCQVPYLGWLGFATYLCASISHLNDWDLKGKEVDVKQE
jgi:benzodiazapine receptor